MGGLSRFSRLRGGSISVAPLEMDALPDMAPLNAPSEAETEEGPPHGGRGGGGGGGGQVAPVARKYSRQLQKPAGRNEGVSEGLKGLAMKGIARGLRGRDIGGGGGGGGFERDTTRKHSMQQFSTHKHSVLCAEVTTKLGRRGNVERSGDRFKTNRESWLSQLVSTQGVLRL